MTTVSNKKHYHACFLIPCYNHGSTIESVVDSLSEFALPVLVVDDGSNYKTKNTLDTLASEKKITLIRLPDNQGKGVAVMEAFQQLFAKGFSHAIQIDADGQHDLDTIPALIEASQSNPDRLISGQPIYDESVPKSRLYGRYLTHVWVWIETLSFSIKDSMCGFRVYPLKPTVDVINKHYIGKRMDFDTEILVRMYWEGTDVDFIPTRVIYPEGGISNFDVLWDNVKISRMHTRLFFGMLPRVRSLITRKRKPQPYSSEHWSKRKEQGTKLGIKTLLAIYRMFGRRSFNQVLKLVIFYYHLTGKSARQASEVYLCQLQQYARQQNIVLPQPLDSYQHLLSFGHTMLDKLAAWQGDFSVDNLTIHGRDHFEEMAKSQQGVVIFASHLGNIELCRALGRRHSHVKINALVFTKHAERFNTVMAAVNPNSELNIIQVNSIGPDTAILLQQKLEQGEWVVIVGDRTSTSVESRVTWTDFLGKPAPFPQGPFILASVLKAPVYLLFGLRDDGADKPHFNVYFEHFSDQITLPRNSRQEVLNSVVRQYAQRLEHHTLQAPLQWYNFFNFWTLSNNNDNK
ncbi:acyltransferase [Vibrio zhanjiangensis]|uniref:Acyltransferase n=1 Tax=Vibrio zhanjiangensis TaxID=1046128 RepID=A0ABQ6EYK8_9VIBR|nr:glycosyltransferase family 2 protein [Vibrio zhanjiangensis]GLT18069.1 acyltransferase [Vibrio zhanjiangensis]